MPSSDLPGLVLVEAEVAAQIQLEVSRQMEELGERTREAMSAATPEVITEFDRLGESLLSKETYWQSASGRRAVTRPGHQCRDARYPARGRQRRMTRHVPWQALSRTTGRHFGKSGRQAE
jgi:hypothetical protein